MPWDAHILKEWMTDQSRQPVFVCLWNFFGYNVLMQVKYISNIVQAPRTSRASLVKGRSQANAVAQQALIAHWQSIVKSLNSYLKTMKANNVSYNSIEDVITTMELFSWKSIIHIDILFFRYLPS